MAYEDYEVSTSNGDPVVFFEFTNLKFGTIYYTNASQPITVNGDTPEERVYQPCPIRFSNVKSTKDVQTSEMTLTFPRNHELPAEMRKPYSQTRTMVVIRRAHRKDFASSLVYWRGRVINVTSKPDTAEVMCENMQTILKRLGNTQKYQKLCRHGLYSMMCGLLYEDWKSDGQVQQIINSFTFRIPEAALQADGYYKGGILDNSGELGFIVSHIGEMITILVPLEDVEVGSTISLAPGCSLAIGTCHSKFNNRLRHGGFPATPSKSPHGGTNIFSAG